MILSAILPSHKHKKNKNVLLLIFMVKKPFFRSIA